MLRSYRWNTILICGGRQLQTLTSYATYIYMWMWSISVWFFPGIFDCQSTHTQWNLSNWKSYKLKAILSTLCIYAWICVETQLCVCRGCYALGVGSDFAAFPLCQRLPTFWFLSDMVKISSFSFCSHVFICVARFRSSTKFRWCCLNDSNAPRHVRRAA